MYKLLTVDVWDTLLRRRSHPDFSKIASAKILSLIEADNIKEEFRDHWNIFLERCRIEGEMARSTSDGEYHITNVLNQLISNILVVCPDKEASSNLAQNLKELELSFEISNTYVDPDISDFLNQFSAERTLFLSDFYMSADDLKKLLRHHSLESILTGGFSSCDIGLNKRIGNIFPHIHRELGITPSEHVHIGDNLEADIANPSRLGITTALFRPEREHHQRLVNENRFFNREQLFTTIEKECQSEVSDALMSQDDRFRAIIKLGIKAAPLFVGFIIHIAESVIKNNSEKLFFFTREGEFFIKVWRAAFPDNNLLGWQLPEAELLEVSRLSTFAASLQEISTSEMMRLWNQYSTQSISAMLKSLGLEPKHFESICGGFAIKLNEEIKYPWQDVRVCQLFKNPEFCNLIQAKIDNDRSLIIRYLTQKGITEEIERIGIVDIGWRGTIQDNLATLLKDKTISGTYLGLLGFLNSQPSNCIKSAFGPNMNAGTDHLDLLNELSLVEMLSNSPNGSVKGYAQSSSGQIEALREIDDAENVAFDTFVNYFQQGVLSATATWSKFIHSHVISSHELREPACKIWSSLLFEQNHHLVSAYTKLNHNEVFGLGGFVDKSIVPSAIDIAVCLLSTNRRRKVLDFCRNYNWSVGLWGRRDLSLAHRFMLVSVCKIFRFLKHVRNLKRSIFSSDFVQET